MTFSRRDFVKTSVLGAVAAGVGAQSAIPEALAENSQQGHASQSGFGQAPDHHLREQRLSLCGGRIRLPEGGGDTLEAGIRVVKGPGG